MVSIFLLLLLLLLMTTHEIRQAIIFLPRGFFLSSFFFSSPYLSGRRLDVYHTWCGLSTNLDCMSEMCCTRLAGNTGRKKSPFLHNRTILSDYIFGTKACIDNREKMLNSNTSATCPDNMVYFGQLTVEIFWRVWGTLQISSSFASWQRYCTAL